MELSLIAVPYHLGRPGAGAADGPDRILRAAAERGLELRDIRVAPSSPFANEVAATMNLNAELASVVCRELVAGRTPVTLSADCSSCLGTLAGMASAATGAARIGVVWLDAHGDFNTAASSPTGYLDGMALAATVGLEWGTVTASLPGFRPIDPANVLHLGGRDFDPGEAERLRGAGAQLIAPIALGFATPDLEGALCRLEARVDAVYLHVDLDVLDPTQGIANAYAAPDGISAAELLVVAGACLTRLPVQAVALTAYDPDFDASGAIAATAARLVQALAAPA